MKPITRRGFAGGIVLLPVLRLTAANAQGGVSPAEARAIAKEAYIYGFPVVDSYRIMHTYFVDRAKARYTLRLAKDELPPVNGFWSVTMYELPSSLLFANPLNRYLINQPMLPQLKKDADGGLTLLIQNESPGKDKEANWLPAPKGPFWIAMRLYWPKDEALEGKWKAPPIQPAG
jgi:hypothetical protein